MGGSSPRERGTHADCDRPKRPRRFIPARAGNTCRLADGTTALRGSSPRERGTRHACRQNQYRAAVHPRASGEHVSRSVRTLRKAGSSPRERGTHLAAQLLQRSLRFIPARAGNTAAHRRRHRLHAVHPRASGEHLHTPGCTAGTAGSSPRERGTLGKARRGLAALRFIPARAGNTLTSASQSMATAVHPRASGEHRCSTTPARWTRGSSPRERGTRDACACSRHWRRFIPARAGNTCRHRPGGGAHTVHPRASGEHAVAADVGCVGDGSSPRERGTRSRRFRGRRRDRFIPARAGNT